MRRPHLLVAVAMLAACSDAPTKSTDLPLSLPALAAAPLSVHSAAPLSAIVWIGCANAGAGEFTQIAGHLRLATFILIGETGRIHIRTSARPDGVVGVGMSTGEKYRGTGGTTEHEHIAASGLPAQYTMVNNFRIIGQGTGNNLLIRSVVHQTVTANGVVTASVSHSSAECR
ncbi:MAG TPA: hypothetical protein VF981_12435 [Gemmatimonadaceae bacterium]